MHNLNSEHDKAFIQWQKCLPLINHENRQCGLRGCKTIFAQGSVIKSDRVRHPLKLLSERTKTRLIKLAHDLDVLALKSGRVHDFFSQKGLKLSKSSRKVINESFTLITRF